MILDIQKVIEYSRSNKLIPPAMFGIWIASLFTVSLSKQIILLNEGAHSISGMLNDFLFTVLFLNVFFIMKSRFFNLVVKDVTDFHFNETVLLINFLPSIYLFLLLPISYIILVMPIMWLSRFVWDCICFIIPVIYARSVNRGTKQFIPVRNFSQKILIKADGFLTWLILFMLIWKL